MYIFSIRVEEKATADAESATGTRRLAPCPRLGTMILYGTSYLPVQSSRRPAMSCTQLVRAVTRVQLSRLLRNRLRTHRLSPACPSSEKRKLPSNITWYGIDWLPVGTAYCSSR
eukprot:SAG11_NODE_2708_length_3062_cov_1.659804_1_plen_114_part_10